MEWKDRVAKYGFPVFIVLAIVVGAGMTVALTHRTPPAESAESAAPPSNTALTTTPAMTTAAATPASTVTTTTTTSSSTATQTRLVVVGAGATDGNSPDFVGKKLGDSSWVSYAAGNGVTFAGGWADRDASTQRMATNLKAIPADVLVIAIGVADEQRDVPFADTTTNIAAMVKTINAPRVVLVGAAPVDKQTDLAVTVNQNLQKLAGKRGWTYLDAAAGVRSGNKYAKGMSNDGVVPNAAGAKLIGAAVHAAILPQ